MLTPDISSGLFYIPDLEPYGSGKGSAFVRPTHIEIFSAPPPVRYRLITYQIGIWVNYHQPDTLDDYEKMMMYHSRLDGGNTFTLTTFAKSLDEATLFEMIRHHFFDIVLRGRAYRNREVALSYLNEKNSSKYEFALDGDKVVLSNLEHYVQIGFNEQKDHVFYTQRVMYYATCVAKNLSHRFTSDQEFPKVNKELYLLASEDLTQKYEEKHQRLEDVFIV